MMNLMAERHLYVLQLQTRGRLIRDSRASFGRDTVGYRQEKASHPDPTLIVGLFCWKPLAPTWMQTEPRSCFCWWSDIMGYEKCFVALDWFFISLSLLDMPVKG